MHTHTHKHTHTHTHTNTTNTHIHTHTHKNGLQLTSCSFHLHYDPTPVLVARTPPGGHTQIWHSPWWSHTDMALPLVVTHRYGTPPGGHTQIWQVLLLSYTLRVSFFRLPPHPRTHTH